MGKGRRRTPPPTTRATGAQGDGGGDDKPMGGPRTAALPRPQRGTAADDGSAETPPRNNASIDGARPDHGALKRCENGLLEPAVRQSTQPTRGTHVARPAMGPQGTRIGGSRRRSGKKPSSVRYLRAAITESETR